jgi:hypothetical protein
MKTVSRLASALSVAFFATALAAPAIASTCGTTASMMAPPPPAAYTHVAVASTNWDLTSTWSPASVPGNGAIVHIPAGIEVRVRTQETARLRFIQVDGTLRFAIQNDTRLLVDTIVIDHFDPLTDDGRFVIGDSVNTVYSNKTAEIVFISWDGNPIDLGDDPEELGRGLVAMGKVLIYGTPKDHMVPLTSNALKTHNSVTLASVPGTWAAGDEVVVTGSVFRRTTADHSSQDEVRTISSIAGNTINFSTPLANDHIIPAGSGFNLHVANLTRNVIFRSESTTEIWERGHIMLMDGRVDIRNAAMIDLGRTNKRVQLDDFDVTIFEDMQSPPVAFDYTIMPNATPTNRRGRYALHFHLNGTSPGSPAPSKVYNSVVRNTIGWGFVSHSSHVDFDSNIAHDFVGAGFITEMGDELGSFTNNIAIRGRGNDTDGYRPAQVVFENVNRPQPLADFGFSGDGFWFQGPALTVTNNVATGCDGAGMMWFTTGAPKVTDRYETSLGSGICHANYSHFPSSWVSTVYAGFTSPGTFTPRYWNGDPTKLVISDLPILEMDGFEGYGNLVGFRLRFNNNHSLGWYQENPFDFHAKMSGPTVHWDDLYTQRVDNLKLWNNEGGFSQRYVTNTDWENVEVVNRLDYTLDGSDPDPSQGAAWIGGETFHFVEKTTFTDLTIDGYEVATRQEANGIDASSAGTGDVIIGGSSSFSNHLLDKTLVPDTTTPVTCTTPSGISIPGTSGTSRTLTVTTGANHEKYMVRYRRPTDQQWRYATATATPTTTNITLTGLTTGRGTITYQYQVAAMCEYLVNSAIKPGVLSYYTAHTTFTNN